MPILTRAKIFDPNKPAICFYVQFNPNSLEYSAYTNKKAYKKVKDSNASDAKNMQSSPIDYGDMASLSVRLFFHTYKSELLYTDVRTEVNRIRAYLRPAASNEQNGGKPVGAGAPKSNVPQIGFAWGTVVFVGSLEGFQVSYQMFASDGTPVQAEVSIAIYGEDREIAAIARERLGTVVYQDDHVARLLSAAVLPPDVRWLFD